MTRTLPLLLLLLVGCSSPAPESQTDVDASMTDQEVVDAALGAIDIRAPNGGELWLVGEPVDIEWSASEEVQQVRIDLFSGVDLVYTVDALIPAQDGRYSWSPSDDVPTGHLMRVQVRNEAGNVSDLSDAPFSLVINELTVLSPEPGAALYIGESSEVSWTPVSGVPTVELSLWEGSTPVMVIEEDVPNTGSFDWDLPDTLPPSRSYRVRVADASVPDRFGHSGRFGVFESRLTVVSPTVGVYGLEQTISVDWAPATGSFVVELVQDDAIVLEIGREVVPNVEWVVPASVPAGSYAIRVSDVGFPAHAATSAPIEIRSVGFELISPTGMDDFQRGSTVPITWATVGDVETVDLHLIRNDAVVETLAAGLTNDGRFDWDVPNLWVGADYSIEIVDLVTGVRGLSPAFHIEGWTHRIPIELITPVDRPDRPVLVVVPDEVLLQTNLDPASIRVSTSDKLGTFDVPHWVENWALGGQSLLWLRPGALPAGSARLYLWIGANDATSTSDEATVFVDEVTATPGMLASLVEADRFIVPVGVAVSLPMGTPVEIRASDVCIEGTINGEGAGHAGGGPMREAGHGPGGGSLPMPTSVHSSGGGYGGRGGDGNAAGTIIPGGQTYGQPDSRTAKMGSGAGGYSTIGGAGGGAVLVFSERILVSGWVNVDGGAPATGQPGAGSGGGVLLDAKVVEIDGLISARGGLSSNIWSGGGGGGRLKLFYQEFLVQSGGMDISGGLAWTDPSGEDGTISLLPAPPEVSVATPERL